MPLPSAVNHILDLSKAGPTTFPQAYECDDGEERVLKLQGLATGQALAAEWIGALLAVEVGVLTPRPCLVNVAPEAIERLPSPELRRRAIPGVAFGSTYIRWAQPVTGWEMVRACAGHATFLARLLVLDSWLDTQDRMRPDFGRNLLVDAVDSPARLTAIDFGMGLTAPMLPILGKAPAIDEVTPFIPKGLPLFLDRTEVQNAIEQVENVTDADLVKLVNSTPPGWVPPQTLGAVIGYLRVRRATLGPALAKVVNGD